MLRKFAVPALALLALPAIASANFEAGDLELTLSGVYSTARDPGDGAAINVDTSIGYFTTDELEFGFRGGVSYLYTNTDAPGIENHNWGSRLGGFVDYHFDLGALQPFVGGWLGYVDQLGEPGDEGWVIAPEVGVKYFVNGTTFVFASLAYDYILDTPDQSFFQGGLGIGFRF